MNIRSLEYASKQVDRAAAAAAINTFGSADAVMPLYSSVAAGANNNQHDMHNT